MWSVEYTTGSGAYVRTEHAQWSRAAQVAVALVADSGRQYTEAEAHDLLEVLRVSTVVGTDGEYLWDDVRRTADAHYTLTIRVWETDAALRSMYADVAR